MSRHTYECELRCQIRVCLGYDRPLREFFLQVQRVDAQTQYGDSPFLYASIDDPYNCPDLHYYRAVLERLGITVPASLFAAVEEDALNNVGNRFVQHFDDGRIEETPLK